MSGQRHSVLSSTSETEDQIKHTGFYSPVQKVPRKSFQIMWYSGSGLQNDGDSIAQANAQQSPPLEQDLTAMLRLKSKSLELCVALLVSNLALVVFLFLQLEYLLEWGFGHGSRDIVLAVEVLHDHASVSNPSIECRFCISFPHTTSPSRSTFSPRTRKIPRGTSA